MVAWPRLLPVTCGCVAGCVWPAAMVTLLGWMSIVVLSLVVSVTVTPLVGAGADKVIGKATD